MTTSREEHNEALAALERLVAKGHVGASEALEAARLITKDETFEFSPEPPPPSGGKTAERGAPEDASAVTPAVADATDDVSQG